MRCFMTLYEIYCITNNITGKRYVGQTSKGYLKRFESHINCALSQQSNKPLYIDLYKYGAQNFTVKRLLYNIPEKDVDYYEKLWIYKLNTLYVNGEGYNISRGGQPIHGYRYTEQQCEKLRQNTKKMWEVLRNNPQKLGCRNKKISNRLAGRPKSEIHRKHLGESRLGKYSGVDNPFYGRKHSLETKLLISQNNSVPIIGQCVKTGKTLHFSNILLANHYVNAQGFTTNKSASTRICLCCKLNMRGMPTHQAYGFIWTYKDKCNDYSERK